MKKNLLVAALLVLPGLAHADGDSVFPLLREIAGDRELPKPYGVSADFVTMYQNYDIQSLAFQLPGVSLSDPNVIGVKNSVREGDLKFDTWVLPFLNVFGVYGHVSADTRVDLSHVPVTGLPFNLGTLNISYSGQSYGGGFTLVYGVDKFFGSVTGTYVDTNLSGDFDSSVHSKSWQPRIGYADGAWAYWVGGLYLDLSEHHHGNIVLPVVGGVPFDVRLREEKKFSPTAGARYRFSDSSDIHVEFGGGDRKVTMINMAYRFD